MSVQGVFRYPRNADFYSRGRKVFAKLSTKKPRKKRVATKGYVDRKIDNMIEDKVIRVNQPSTTGVGAISDYIPLNTCQQGPALGQRNGQKIRMKSLQLNISFVIDPSGLVGATTGYFFRWMLLYDKQANGALPSNAQLFYNTTAGETYESPLNIAGSKRYTILADRTVGVNVAGGSTNASTQHSVRRKFNLRNKTVTYNSGNAGNITDINTGALHLVMMCDAFIIATWHTELRYEDA